MATQTEAQHKALKKFSDEYFRGGIAAVAQTNGIVIRSPAAKREKSTAVVPWRRTNLLTRGYNFRNRLDFCTNRAARWCAA
jgi:hypothetical protein